MVVEIKYDQKGTDNQFSVIEYDTNIRGNLASPYYLQAVK